ncbi:MAG: hypothetical protein D6686_08185 [Alphaproteobacteria bacterium]|nr:MAG: hypothetical protein D6686_08185 [Alphaproteobacteria bacterium]
MAPDHAHTAAIRIDAPAAFAFACLSDPRQVGRWALGCMDLRPAGAEGVWRGHSLLDGAEGFVEIRPRPDL